MPVESGTTEAVVDSVVINDPIPPDTGSEAQKPETPAAADDKTAESAVETTEQQEEKKQSKFQRRLDRQKAARVAAETEARLLREQLAKLEGKEAPKPAGEPQRDQYPDYESYLRAVTKYDIAQESDKRSKAEREDRQRGEKQAQVAAGHEKLAQDWIGREKAFQAATKDYESVVMPFVDEELSSFPDGTRRAIVESEVGPQLLYHLASNPEVTERISELSPLRQIAELGKLEATLSAPVTKKTSNAPAPIGEAPKGRSTAPGYSDNMTDEQYRAWRKSQGARWAG